MNQYAGTSPSLGRNQPLCDLRSDTVTRPDAGMMAAIAAADLGDDVYGEDPSVNRLEALLAERLGKEAGLLLPTGTPSHPVALLAHCGRGEEILVGVDYHVNKYEAAGASVLGGIALCPLPIQGDGSLHPDAIAAAVKADRCDIYTDVDGVWKTPITARLFRWRRPKPPPMRRAGWGWRFIWTGPGSLTQSRRLDVPSRIWPRSLIPFRFVSPKGSAHLQDRFWWAPGI